MLRMSKLAMSDICTGIDPLCTVCVAAASTGKLAARQHATRYAAQKVFIIEQVSKRRGAKEGVRPDSVAIKMN